MKTNRRKFLESAGLGLTGIFLNGKVKANSLEEDDLLVRRWVDYENNLPGLEGGVNPRDVKINVKLIYYAKINTTTWDGPCVYSEMPEPEERKIQARNAFDATVKRLKDSLSKDAKFLEPAYFEFPENATPGREDLIKLESDKDEVDVYILQGTGSHPEVYFASLLAAIYKKPIVPSAHYGRTTSAYLKSTGVEGYPAYVYGGLTKLISLLRARKAFQNCNMLLITDIRGAFKGAGYMRGSVRDFDDIKNRFGIGTTIVRYKELSDERDRIMRDKNSMKEVENLTDKIFRNAQGFHMDKKVFEGDILFYYTVKSLMHKYNCNAYSIECIEFCASRLPQAWKITPCVSFSLLNGEGYPTSCEGEIGCLLAMNLFSAISNKSCFMGNLNPYSPGSADPDQWVKGADKEKAKFRFGHNVPGLKMLGYDKPDLPYDIMNFVPAKDNISGWGSSFKIDFTKIDEKTLTIGRFNPLTTKMLVTKAEVIGQRGFYVERCSTEIHINIQDPEGYHLKTADYGHHYVGVHGDYVQELVHLADMLKIELELHAV